MNNTALVRIKKEYDLIKNDPPENFVAYPIKDDLFTWHFTIRGADETEFENGVYHGIIKLPTSYPFKPPNITFLTPSGRFDVNVDVCLSVTKYHKEEWQAAWTIRTMLEAIIAFFPVKEDHDAIGAIDYPIEARKKLAVQSRKWKCEICGPIIDLLPDKKPKTEIQKEKETIAPVESSSNRKESDKEIDNKSDNSSPLNQKLETSSENKSTKRDKNSKHKKTELDRKSHLSNIEGVIFEEEAENEEEIELKINRYHTELIEDSHYQNMLKSNSNNSNSKALDSNSKLKNDSTQNSNNNLKRSNSDEPNNNLDFSEYLRKIRQSQFGDSTENQTNEIRLKNISINNPEQIKLNEEKNNSNFNIQESIKEISENLIADPKVIKPKNSQKILIKNILKESSSEEIEFFDTINTIKCHKSNTNEAIIKDLYLDKLESVLNKKDEFGISQLLKGMILEQNNDINRKVENSIETTNSSKLKNLQLNEELNFFRDQDKIESFIKQKNSILKFLTRKSYKEARSKRLKIINFIMASIILCVFGLYYYIRNFS